MLEDAHKTQNPIEPFLLLAKSVRGTAAAQLVYQATEAPGIYVFGELAEIPSIKQLQVDSPKDWKLLQLFSFGTFQDYKSNKDYYPELSEKQIFKLRHLTIAFLASKSKHVPYKLLQKELEIDNLRQLEDLIIEAIYAGILKGKLDQSRKQLEVEFVIGRDLRVETIDFMLDILESWSSNCRAALTTLETQICRANDVKDLKASLRKDTEAEVENVKKALKAQSQEMNQDDVEASSSSSLPMTPTKHSKMKSLKTTLKPSSAGSSRTR